MLDGVDGLARLLQAQEVVGTIEQTYVTAVSFQQQAAIGLALDGESFVALLPLLLATVSLQRDGSTVPVTAQLVHRDLYCRRGCRRGMAVVG